MVFYFIIEASSRKGYNYPTDRKVAVSGSWGQQVDSSSPKQAGTRLQLVKKLCTEGGRGKLANAFMEGEKRVFLDGMGSFLDLL